MSAICADTGDQALRLSASARMLLLNLYRGRLTPVPPVERAIAFLEQQGESIAAVPPNRRMITGDGTKVRKSIESVADDYRAEEVFVVNIVHSHEARCRSYELIASAFELGGR